MNATASDAPSAESLGRLGFRLSRENRPTEALAAFRAAADLAPDNPLMWLNLATAQDRAGDLDEALRCLERSLALADRQSDAWLLLGSVKLRRADLAGAENAYREALRLDPHTPLGWQCLGLVKQERGNLTEAVDCFLVCVALGAGSAGILGNLGRLCYQLGRIPEAIESYGSALRVEPENASFAEMLRRAEFLQAMIDGSEVDAALAHWERAGLQVTDRIDLLKNAFTFLNGFGHVSAAERVGRKWLELAPDSATANYLVKVAAGDVALDRSPTEYLVEYFDGFAAGFDEKLVQRLGYDLPTRLCSAIAGLIGAGARLDTLDIGCGTGLCGPLLRPFTGELIGVDLSPRMLDQARQRQVYDNLFCEDLVTFLRKSHGCFDLIVAADVLIYLGDLQPVWEAAFNALRPGGLLAFSTESAAEEGYRVQKSGRFTHSRAYVSATTATGFEMRVCEEFIVRQEAGQPIRGHFYVLTRR